MMLGDQAIRLGDANLIFAGGMESMTLAPHLIPKARAGYKFGGFEVRDHMQFTVLGSLRGCTHGELWGNMRG